MVLELTGFGYGLGTVSFFMATNTQLSLDVKFDVYADACLKTTFMT